jgi:hypothetical protein
MGGHLTSIGSQEENDLVYSYVGDASLWIGADSKVFVDDATIWVWTDNTTWSHENRALPHHPSTNMRLCLEEHKDIRVPQDEGNGSMRTVPVSLLYNNVARPYVSGCPYVRYKRFQIGGFGEPFWRPGARAVAVATWMMYQFWWTAYSVSKIIMIIIIIIMINACL